MHFLSSFRLLWLVCLIVFMGGVDAQASSTLRVGSKRFTESYILAELIAQTAQRAGVQAEVKQGLGNTAIVFEALRAGQIDVYAEYTGTIALEILKGAPDMDLASMGRALAPLGLGVATPLGFNDGYALAMRQDQSQALGLTTLSQLKQHPGLRLGLSNEFIGRADGWAPLAARYQLSHKPQGIDHGLAYDALANAQIDVTDIYSTDAKIEHLKLQVLKDDLAFFPRYEAVLLYRLDLPQRLPQAWQSLQSLAGRVNEAQMIRMNAQAELQGLPFAQIAQQFLAGQSQDKAVRGFWQKLFAPDLWRLTGQHLLLVMGSVLAAALIAIPLGIALFPHPRWRSAVLSVAGLLQTIPSLALLAILISALGVIGPVPAMLALMLYALLPILSNTLAGLASVTPGLRAAAQALGMRNGQSLRYIELPLAMPTLIAGLRTASAIAIGTATIAAFIGAGGLGERIVTGLALNDRELMLAGALPSALLALVSELCFELLGRRARRR